MKLLLFSHSLKNTYRSPLKSLLYVFLIGAITALLCLELSIFVSVQHFLREADETFTTIAVYESTGDWYPNEDVYDAGIDPKREELMNSVAVTDPAFLSFNPAAKAIGTLKNTETGLSTERSRADMPLTAEAVLVLTVRDGEDWQGYRNAIVNEVLFSHRDASDKYVYLSYEDEDIELISGHTYIVHGSYFLSYTSNLYFRIEPVELDRAADANFSVNGEINPDPQAVETGIIDLGANWDQVVPENNLLSVVADSYYTTHHSITVYSTADLNAELPFHQERQTVIDGRGFTEAEYLNGGKVAIISQLLAERLELSVGDRADLGYANRQASTLMESYWAGTGFDVQETVEIVGIFNTVRDTQHHVYVPESEHFPIESHYGYTLGTAVIENSGRDAYFNAQDSGLSDEIRVTIYDQGYAAVTDSFHDIRATTILVTVISIFAALLILLLFAYMSVYRERENSRILIRLGVAPGQVKLFLLYLPAVISLLSVFLGAMFGYLYSRSVMEFILGLATSSRQADLRYSITNLSINLELAFEAATPVLLFITTAAVIFVFGLLFCFTIAHLILRTKPQKVRLRKKRERSAVSRSLRGGSIKYASLSIVRSGVRSLLPFIAVIGSLSLLFQMSTTKQATEQHLSNVRESSSIQAFFTNYAGTQNQGLLVDQYAVRDLARSGLVESMSVSFREDYWYNGRYPGGGDTFIEEAIPEFAPSSFGVETMLNQLALKPDLVYTPDIRNTPDFLYSSNVEIEFLDGYSEEDFAVREVADPTSANVVVPVSMMEEYGIELGDVIQFMVVRSYTGYSEFPTVKVVGSYEASGMREHIFLPLANYISPDVMFEVGSELEAVLQRAPYGVSSLNPQDRFMNYFPGGEGVIDFGSAVFTVPSENLAELKDFLQQSGFSQVNRIGRIRQFVILSDAQYLSLEASLIQRTNYMNVMYPLIYALIIILALLIPLILILVRRREITVMRQTGTQPIRVFMSFYVELFSFAAVGASFAILLRRVLGYGVNEEGILLMSLFILVWLLASLISVLLLAKGPVRRYAGQGE